MKTTPESLQKSYFFPGISPQSPTFALFFFLKKKVLLSSYFFLHGSAWKPLGVMYDMTDP